jgi:hypothetical protein
MLSAMRSAPLFTTAPPARRPAGLLLLAALWAGGGVPAAAAQDPPRLEVLERHTLPLRELSGLARVPRPDGGPELYAVGDAGFEVAHFRRHPAAPGAGLRIRSPVRPAPAGDSQWEAAAVDGCGNLCVLAEDSGRVTCFDAGLTRTLGHFDLDPSGVAGLAGPWRREENSRGEGMVLTGNGHLLLLKEKRPALLVEFGPPGHSPRGWNAGAAADQPDCRIPPPAPVLVALKVWEFAKSLRRQAEDASELAAGPDGRLYLLSQQSALLFRLEARLKPGENKVHADAVWRLPRDFGTAEGLVLDADLHPWVALDLKQTDQPNLFRLSSLRALR